MTIFRAKQFLWTVLGFLALGSAACAYAQDAMLSGDNAGQTTIISESPAVTSPVPNDVISVTPANNNALPAPVIIQAAPPQPPPPIIKPVEAVHLSDINPEAIGLLSASDGGLGAALWNGTPRSVVEKLLPALRLPAASPAMNSLARRLLISTTAVPAGSSSINQSLPSLRVGKLIALGDVADAWKLATMAKPEQMNEVDLRLAAEALLVNSVSGVDVCALLPDMIKIHNGPDWQKMMVVCQLRAKDTKAAQLGLDVLHAEDVQDEAFFALAEKNILGNSKQLPKQLAPLTPVTSALMQLTDLDMPSEAYTNVEARLVPALLDAPTKDEDARLNFAEHAASQGILTVAQLAAVYNSISPAPINAIKNANTVNAAPQMRALLYQAATQDNAPLGRLSDAAKFIQSAPPGLLAGAGGGILADMVHSIPAQLDYYNYAPMMVRIYLLAGRTAAAMEWLRLFQNITNQNAIAVDMQKLWPIMILSGLGSDQTFAADRDRWLAVTQSDHLLSRDQAAALLLLLNAAGYVVSDNDWTAVLDAPDSDDHDASSALVLARLHAAAADNHRGEVILLSLLAADNVKDPRSSAVLEIIRALRSVGLVVDAASYASEAAAQIIYAAPAIPAVTP